MCDGPFGSDMKSSHYSESGIRIVRLQNIGCGTFADVDRAFISEEHFLALPGHDAKPGDLLVASLGDDRRPAGRACLLPDDVPVAMVKADCFRLRLDPRRMTHAYCAWFLNSAASRDAVALESRGVTRTRINLSGLSRLRVPVPPLIEQEAIAVELQGRSIAINAAIAATELSIAALQELRKATVAAAVSGCLPREREVA